MFRFLGCVVLGLGFLLIFAGCRHHARPVDPPAPTPYTAEMPPP
jgi:hypothetical protein